MLFRRVRSLVSPVLMLAVLATTLLAGPAVPAALADSLRPQDYLALGDSIPFGYNPLVNPTNPTNFSGYPDTVAAALKLNLTNTACPGETSTHFINVTSPVDNGCGAWRFGYPLPLHTAYTTSQLDFMDAFLQSHPKTLVITLDIGANDVFVLQNNCGGTQTPAQINCILTGLPGVLATLAANLDTIYGHIRNVDGYHHKIVALTYYSFNYNDPLTSGVALQVNQVLAARTLAWGGLVADGFSTFAAASGAGGDPCAAGLLIAVSAAPLKCDIHPSPAGRNLLAQAIVKALRPD